MVTDGEVVRVRSHIIDGGHRHAEGMTRPVCVLGGHSGIDGSVAFLIVTRATEWRRAYSDSQLQRTVHHGGESQQVLEVAAHGDPQSGMSVLSLFFYSEN